MKTSLDKNYENLEVIFLQANVGEKEMVTKVNSGKLIQILFRNFSFLSETDRIIGKLIRNKALSQKMIFHEIGKFRENLDEFSRICQDFFVTMESYSQRL